VAVLAAVRAYGASGAPARTRSAQVSGRAILQRAGRELSEVNRARQAEGWTEALMARAGAAMRVVAGYAIDRPASQSKGLAANAADGQFALSQGLVRRRHVLVSAAVTPADLDGAAATNGAVQRVRDGLSALTAARYGRSRVDEGVVESAVNAAGELAGSLAWRHSWPIVQWSRFTRRVADWQGH